MCNFLKSLLEDLKRLDLDDVKNSEYIEEDEIRRFSEVQRSQFFRNSNVVLSNAGDDVMFKFEGTNSGILKNSNLNRSHDVNNQVRVTE